VTIASSLEIDHVKGPVRAAAISIRNLVKRYDNVVAVDGISLDVPAGQIFALLGPNGAGKTTTIQMLTTLLLPSSGTMLIDDIDPTRKPYEVRNCFGIVFQDPSLDTELTAAENLELHAVLYRVPRRSRPERIESVLRLFELWDRRDSQVKQFSGGMKRRLEVGRGLLHRPKILFLDEPTLGLDPQSRNLLWTQVKQMNVTEGMTVFLTTHYMEEAERVADRIAIIDRGRIVAQGSPADLRYQTDASSLEEAFLVLTGTAVRTERAGSGDHLRSLARQQAR
jgi:ABC-2 type transport system ATP-binding protein